MSPRAGVDRVVVVVCTAAAGVAFDRAFPVRLLAPVVAGAAVLPALLMWHRRVRVVAHVLSLGWLFVLVSRSALALLAITLPAPPDPWLIAVPAGLTWIGTATGLELALRAPRSGRLAALLPTAPAWVYGAFLGTHTPLDTVLAVVGGCCVAIQLVPATPVGNRRWAGPLATLASLAVVALVAGFAVPAATVAVGQRTRVDPRDALSYVRLPPSTANPIDWVDVWLTHPDVQLFTGIAGEPVKYWRLVVLPTYDGQRWLPPQRYTRAGRGVPEPAGHLDGSVTQTVTVGTLAGPFLPTVDRPTRIGSPVSAVDVDSGVLISSTPLRPGQRYTVQSSSPAPLGEDTCGPGSPQPVPPELAPALAELAGGACSAGFATFAAGLERRVNTGRANVAGVPSAGTDLAVLAAFLKTGQSDPPRGTIVEFAGAFALAVRAAGLPSRLVVGFAGDKGPEIYGRDVRIWVEVQLPGHGWVAYHPAPPPPTQQQQQRTTSQVPMTAPDNVVPQPDPTRVPLRRRYPLGWPSRYRCCSFSRASPLPATWPSSQWRPHCGGRGAAGGDPDANVPSPRGTTRSMSSTGGWRTARCGRLRPNRPASC